MDRIHRLLLNPSSSENALIQCRPINSKGKFKIHLSENRYSLLLFDQSSLIIYLAVFVSGNTDCFVLSNHEPTLFSRILCWLSMHTNDLL